MPNMVHVGLEAKGQALTVTQAPPVLASDAIGKVIFDVSFSDEWEGFERYALLMKNGRTVRSCDIAAGVACADRDALADDGMLEVAVVAYGDGTRLTTERVIIRLLNSGL